MNTVKKIKNIKKTTLILFLLAFIIIALILFSPYTFITLMNSFYKRSYSKQDYLNNNYVTYNGGKEAQVFFEKFVNLEGNKEISFKYRDNDKALTLKNACHTVFALDVNYNPEDYNTHFNNIWNYTNTPNINDDKNYYGSFLMSAIMLEDDVYTNNYCGVFFDNSNCTIRYLFFYNVNRNNAINNIISIIKSSILLEWHE